MPERLHFGRRNRKTWIILKPTRRLLYRHSGKCFWKKGRNRESKCEKRRRKGGKRRRLTQAGLIASVAVLVQQDREGSCAARAAHALERL